MKRGIAIAKGARRRVRVHACSAAAAAAAVLSAPMPASAIADGAPRADGGAELTKLQSDPRAVPTIATLASPSITLGAGQLADLAVVSGRVDPQPGATVSFALYGPDDVSCAGQPVFQSPGVPYPVGGGAVISAPFTPVAAGTYRWRASYSGDANNQPVTAPCNDANENVVVLAPTSMGSSTAFPLLAPFPIVRVVGRTEGRGVRINLLTVRAQTGSYIVTTCTGKAKGCPYRERITQILGTPGRVRTEHIRGFERAFRTGIILRVFVVMEGRTGKFTSFKIRRRHLPVRTDRCLQGMSMVPEPCPIG